MHNYEGNGIIYFSEWVIFDDFFNLDGCYGQ